MNQVVLHSLAKLQPPIFDEKVRQETGVLDVSRHNALKKRARELRSRSAAIDDLYALLDLLYVLRCNLFKGYKLRDSSRDQEVLAAAAPALLPIAKELLRLHELAVEHSAKGSSA